MSGNVNMKILQAYLKLKKNADAGDPKAKAELAKLQASPQAVAKLRAIAAQAQQTAQMVTALAVASSPSTQVQGDEGQMSSSDEIYDGDDIDDAERAHRQLPPGSDSLDHKALLRRIKAANLTSTAPFVNQNPPGVLAGITGNVATVKPGDLVQVANFATDDAHSTTLSIVVAPVQQQVTTDKDFVTDPLALGASLGNRAYAKIQFGNKGFAVAAFIDIGLGQQLDVSGSMVTVEVGLKINPNITTTAMQLAGMVASYKPIMRTAPLTYTIYADDVGVVSTNIYPIPPFAKRVWFIKQSPADVVTFEVINFAHSPPGNFQYIGTPAATIPANTQMSDSIILPADAIAVSATNVAGNAQGRFIFELGI